MIRTLALALLLSSPVLAADGHQHHGARPVPAARPGCPAEDTRLACATQANPAFLADGTLLLTWVAGGRVMAARSGDLGGSFESPAALNAGPETIDANTDARVVTASDTQGRVYVAWAKRKDARYNGALMLARSPDGGRSFHPARPLTADPSSQRFPALAVGDGGRLYAAWIDKREEEAAKKAGKAYRGGALAVAWSDDGGETFAHEAMAQSFACECCRVVMDLDRRGLPVLMWRHIFEPNIRDHAVMAFADRDHLGPIRKISDDNWRIDACPHAGPSLTVAADGSVHGAWYAGGGNRKDLFVASALGAEAPFSAPRPLGDAARAPSQPQLLSQGTRLWAVWKEFDGETTSVQAQGSDDAGRSWSEPRTIAQTRDSSDRPVLVGDGKRVFVSWLSAAEGWRLMALE